MPGGLAGSREPAACLADDVDEGEVHHNLWLPNCPGTSQEGEMQTEENESAMDHWDLSTQHPDRDPANVLAGKLSESCRASAIGQRTRMAEMAICLQSAVVGPSRKCIAAIAVSIAPKARPKKVWPTTPISVLKYGRKPFGP